MGRAERLQERFKLIQQTLKDLHGKDLAFAAASAAWLQAIQYATEQSMKRIKNEVEAEDGPVYLQGGFDNLIIQLDAEHEALLRSFHKELCSHLEVDPEQALELSKAFTQVVRDICLQGG